MELPYLRSLLGLMLCTSCFLSLGDPFEPTLREAPGR